MKNHSRRTNHKSQDQA